MQFAITAATACVLLTSVVPASATAEFYIVLDENKRRCQLVTVPPQTTSLDLLAGGVVFFDEQQAQTAMRSLQECAPAEASARASTQRN